MPRLSGFELCSRWVPLTTTTTTTTSTSTFAFASSTCILLMKLNRKA